VSSNQV